MSALSGLIWSYLELQDPPQDLLVQLPERYIRQGGKGGTMQGGLAGVSAKGEVHSLVCLTWPPDENIIIIIIIKKLAEPFIAGLYHFLSYSSQQNCQKIMLKKCCFKVQTSAALHHGHNAVKMC